MVEYLEELGITSDFLYSAAIASVFGSVYLYSRAGRKDDPNRARQRAIFVGLWPPTFMAFGNALKQMER